MGEIYKAITTTSTPNDSNNALDKLTEIFVKNEYPEKLITIKIKEIKNRNFQPSIPKIEKEREFRENSHRTFKSYIYT